MARNTMAGPVDARVIQTPFGFLVRPPDVFKRSGDEFTLLNLARITVHVSFPALQTDPGEADIRPGATEVFKILDAAPGMYDYWVEIALTNHEIDFTLRASGASDPHIIIDF
jgi:hypothetical protein